MRTTLLIFWLLGCACLPALSVERLSPAEAKSHIGERATVCGNVTSARYAERSRGRPTFLNLDKPYPDTIFTILIWGENRASFGEPERKYLNKNICVSGMIQDYRGTPEIVASEPGQIQASESH